VEGTRAESLPPLSPSLTPPLSPSLTPPLSPSLTPPPSQAPYLGDHSLGGSVIEPRALDELCPGWRDDSALAGPVLRPVERDELWWLAPPGVPEALRRIRLPIPRGLRGDLHGSQLGSQSGLVRWLGARVVEAGVRVFTSTSAGSLVLAPGGSVAGVVTGERGRGKDGGPRRRQGAADDDDDNEEVVEDGVEVRARATLLAEGARGPLATSVMARFGLRGINSAQPAHYALGIREVWRLPRGSAAADVMRGSAVHAVGWPLSRRRLYGGGFLFSMPGDAVAVGLVTDLSFRDPWISPKGEFDAFKTHPAVAEVLEGAECVEFGAKTLSEGGVQSVPHCSFPGGAILGCSAGFLNTGKGIKGVHTAMKSGMLAAEAAAAALGAGRGQTARASTVPAADPAADPSTAQSTASPTPQSAPLTPTAPLPTSPAPSQPPPPLRHPRPPGAVVPWWGITPGGSLPAAFSPRPGAEAFVDLSAYDALVRASWVWEELWASRNLRPALQGGFGIKGMLLAALDGFVVRGRSGVTLLHSEQSLELDRASDCVPIDYPEPDGRLTFTVADSLERSGLVSEPDQPLHLRLQVDRLFYSHLAWSRDRGAESRYCPAGVFEWLAVDDPRLVHFRGVLPTSRRWMASNFPHDAHRKETKRLLEDVERVQEGPSSALGSRGRLRLPAHP